MRGDLHRGRVKAAFAHEGQQGMDIGGLGRGEEARNRRPSGQDLDGADQSCLLPEGLQWVRLTADGYAHTVGALRGSPGEQRLAHAQRLALSPVPYQGFAVQRVSDGTTLACGQFAREADLVGLYDVFTHPDARQQGLATLLCERLLSLAAQEGGRTGYLQVENDNPARRIYARLGFVEGYRYHYRQAPA